MEGNFRLNVFSKARPSSLLRESNTGCQARCDVDNRLCQGCLDTIAGKATYLSKIQGKGRPQVLREVRIKSS